MGTMFIKCIKHLLQLAVNSVNFFFKQIAKFAEYYRTVSNRAYK